MPDTRLTTQSKDVFISERPIVWQAWLDLTQFSKAQVIPASIMAGAAFIAALVTGQVTSVWSALLFLVCSVVAGLVFYAVIAILRAPLIVIGHHHRQISDMHQRLLDTESQLADVFAMKQLPASVPAPAKAEPLEPNIIYLSAEIVEAHRQHGGAIYEGRGPFNSLNRRQEWFLACVVSFRNEVLKTREIGGRGLVSAKISYVFQEQAGSKTASRAAWFGTDRFHVTFGTNDTPRSCRSDV